MPGAGASAIDPNAVNLNGASLQAWANSFALQFGVPVDLFSNLIGHESSWNTAAKGAAGEIGLGQIMPSTAATTLGGVNVNDPIINLAASASLLSRLYKSNGNDWTTALAAYNGGEGGKSSAQAQNYASQVIAGLDSSGRPLAYGQPVDATTGVPAAIAGLVNDTIATVGGFKQQLNAAAGTVELVGVNEITGLTSPLVGADDSPIWLGPAFDSNAGPTATTTSGNLNFTQLADKNLSPDQKAILAGTPSAPGTGIGIPGLGSLSMQNVAVYGGLILVIVATVVIGFAVLGKSTLAEATNHG